MRRRARCLAVVKFVGVQKKKSGNWQASIGVGGRKKGGAQRTIGAARGGESYAALTRFVLRAAL